MNGQPVSCPKYFVPLNLPGEGKIGGDGEIGERIEGVVRVHIQAPNEPVAAKRGGVRSYQRTWTARRASGARKTAKEGAGGVGEESVFRTCNLLEY